MNLGNILSFLSPAVGLATGKGFGKIAPFLSPALGLAEGGGMGAMGLFGLLSQHPELLQGLMGRGQGQHANYLQPMGMYGQNLDLGAGPPGMGFYGQNLNLGA